MRGEVLMPFRGVRPARVLGDGLAPKLVGNTERLARTEARNAFVPVGVFGVAHGPPVAGHELADSARVHVSIVARTRQTLGHVAESRRAATLPTAKQRARVDV